MKAIQITLIAFCLIIIGAIIYLAILPDPPDWTGFGESIKDDKKEAAKTLWDWLDLLIIPFAIGLIGWAFSQIEKAKTNKRDEESSQNEVLESFLNTITNLIIDNRLHNDPTQQSLAIARARINIAVNNLNGHRKGQVLQFLYESDLIDIEPKLRILGVNLQNAVLDEIVLGKSEIKGAYFNFASIQNANLNGAILIGCDFSYANLSKSLVKDVDLSYSNLTGAKLQDMDLTSVNLEGANLTEANLKGSRILRTQLDNIFEKRNIKLSKANVI
jgi:uncharacterized protein YjbI with pentapeptide repeats